MRALMWSTLKIVVPNTVGEFRKLFSPVWIAFIFGKLAEFFLLTNVLFSNYRSCFLRTFEGFCNCGKRKNPATSCMQITLNPTLLRICPSWHSPFKFSDGVVVCSCLFIHLWRFFTRLTCVLFHPRSPASSNQHQDERLRQPYNKHHLGRAASHRPPSPNRLYHRVEGQAPAFGIILACFFQVERDFRWSGSLLCGQKFEWWLSNTIPRPR